MKFLKQSIVVFFLLMGCIEPYQFRIIDNNPKLVVEGFITDKSFSESLQFPSDGRYFEVKLSYTSDVINERGETVSGALVRLVDKVGVIQNYVETASGVYTLLNPEFKAVAETEYKIEVVISDDERYESNWSTLPIEESFQVGDINFSEVEKLAYKYDAGEQVVRTVKGINSNVQLPSRDGNKSIYYQWSFEPMWIYEAPLSRSRCWATSKYYLSDYALREDRVGGYSSSLFFIETIRNERIYEDFSVLVAQRIVDKEYFFFLKGLQEQNQGGLLSDKPPYNLPTNMLTIAGDRGVVGYFTVASEQAKRWYFNKKDLSYNVENTLLKDCLIVYGPGGPAPECSNCSAYSNGDAQGEMPSWWRK